MEEGQPVLRTLYEVGVSPRLRILAQVPFWDRAVHCSKPCARTPQLTLVLNDTSLLQLCVQFAWY